MYSNSSTYLSLLFEQIMYFHDDFGSKSISHTIKATKFGPKATPMTKTSLDNGLRSTKTKFR